ncbi:DUF4856 domain-containing protein [Pseudofulvibacter geojedonensis]|uniref:DUF4856 domain-containing protein n=1 Tax=Pseudofulvibacter geojedonensis TaxID=1123758 RepID=A0ABW3I253_9FLAO
MRKVVLSLAVVTALSFVSCSSDDNNGGATPTFAKTVADINLDGVVAPATYNWTRNNATSVSYGGQTTRINMLDYITNKQGDEGLKNTARTEAQLKGMYNHTANDGFFSDATLNSSGKNIKGKTGNSDDFFSGTVEGSQIKTYFDGLITDQVANVFPNWSTNAAAGTAGQLADGSSTRYVNAKGYENDQLFAKGLIGALQVDQATNNYMSRVANDDNSTVENNYTDMEHHFDEAYGYLLNSADSNYFNKYLGKVDADTDFTGIKNEIETAFRIARQAIVDQKYDVRDQAIEVIRYQVSRVIAIRAVYYLQAGKNQLDDASGKGPAFHDLSEGLGFVYSLRFIRKSDVKETYFTKAEVDGLLNDLIGSTNGLWDLTGADLDAVSEAIAAKFDFTVAQAGS